MIGKIRFLAVCVAWSTLSGAVANAVMRTVDLSAVDGTVVATGKECARPLAYWTEGTDNVQLPEMDLTAGRMAVEWDIKSPNSTGLDSDDPMKFLPEIKSGTPQGFNEEDIYMLPGEKIELYSVSLADEYMKGYSRWYQWRNNLDDTTQYRWVKQHIIPDGASKGEKLALYDKGLITLDGGVSHVTYHAGESDDGGADGIIDTIGWDFVSYKVSNRVGAGIPELSLQRRYIIRNARIRYDSLKAKKERCDSHKAEEGGDFRPWNHPECFLERFTIHLPGTGKYANFRLAENIANYYVSTTGDKNQKYSNSPRKIRWRMYDETGNQLQEKIKTHKYQLGEINPSLNDIANIWNVQTETVERNRTLRYITAEASNNDRDWYPISLLTVWFEPFAEPHTHTELEKLAKEHPSPEIRETYTGRLQDTIDNTLHLLNRIDFDGNDVMTRKPKPEENYAPDFKNIIGVATTPPAYAFGDIQRYDTGERPINKRTIARGEYALYRTLNVGGISKVDNNATLGYSDWWARIRGSGNTEKGYPVEVYDRTYAETLRKEGTGKYGYFLYVDASDVPGHITTIPVEGGLCPNTRIIVTAWIANMLEKEDATASRADVAFTFKGIRADGRRDIINKFYTGNLDIKPSPAEALGHKDNPLTAEWQQIYFWFDFSGDMVGYESYELEVANNCFNSNGADFGLDDICIYRTNPDVKVVRTGKCNTSDILINATFDDLLANFGLEYGGTVLPDEAKNLLTGKPRYLRFGLAENEANVYVAMLDDKERWIEGVKYNGQESTVTQYGRVVLPTDTATLKRLDASEPGQLQLMVDSISNERNKQAFEEYKQWYAAQDDKAGLPAPEGLTPVQMFNALGIPPIQCVYRTAGQKGQGVHMMNIRHNPGDTELRPGQQYTIFVHSSLVLDIIDVHDPCALTQKFTVETYVDISAESESGITEGFCLNSDLNVTARLNSTKGDTISHDICGFDWYMGAFDKNNHRSYVNERVELSDGTVLSLEDALAWFHEALGDNPDDAALAALSSWTPVSEDDRRVYGFLDSLVKEDMLRLNAWRFKTRLKALENYMVAIPFLKKQDYSEREFLCLSPEELKITTTPRTPDVWIGIPGMGYPDDTFNPAIRLGLDHIEAFKEQGEMKVTIRRVDFEYEQADSLGFSVVDTPDDTQVCFDTVMLYATTDIDCPMDMYEVVGRVKEIHYVQGEKDEAGNQVGYITIRLDDGFKPREGYSYTLGIPYQEYDSKHGIKPETCTGVLRLELKIVPEYLTFIGNEADFQNEWNRDANWRRTSEAEAYMGSRREGVDAKSAVVGDRRELDAAFAPLYFSKVTITGDARPELYDVGQAGRPDGVAVLQDAGDTIVYDLMMDDAAGDDGFLAMTCYQANACSEVYFKPDAVLLGAQHLVYDTARVEFEMKNMQPYWLTVPLRGVVAGDLYSPEYGTDMKGRQQTPAFDPIVYGKTTPNYRFDPAYYQRAWEKTVHVFLSDGRVDTFALEQANWSVDYNDVDVPYQPGHGFYARVEMGNFSEAESALVRLPKADVAYGYEEMRNPSAAPERMRRMMAACTPSAAAGSAKPIDRTAAGRLASDEAQVVVPLRGVDEGHKFMLVGNPYMACLDMDKFFELNSDILWPRYWSVEDGAPTLTNRADNAWMQAGNKTGEVRIAPMQAFFVEVKEGVPAGGITFTPEMVVAAPAKVEEGSGMRMLTLRAESRGLAGEAVIIGAGQAMDGYNPEEDVVVFSDSEPGLDAPVAYTVASGRVLSVNALPYCNNVPIGVCNTSGETVRLTISGISSWGENLSLYDAATDRSTPLYADSHTMEVVGDCHGRYFLRELRLGGGRDNGSIVYTPAAGIAVVAATLPIRTVRVYAPNGTSYAVVDAGNSASCTIPLPQGLYVLQVDMGSLAETHKLWVP